MQGFLFGRSTREHFLKLLGSMVNNIEHNFVDTISVERILQWRAAVQELIRVGFAVEFLLDHQQEIAQAFFMKKVQPAVDAIDACIKVLKKEMANLEAHCERLLFGVTGPSCFGDKPLFQAFDQTITLCIFISFPHVYFSSLSPFLPTQYTSLFLQCLFDKSGMTYIFWVCNLSCHICYSYYYVFVIQYVLLIFHGLHYSLFFCN